MRETMTGKKLVIANNYEQFRQYCLFNDLKFNDFKGLLSPDDIRGYGDTELLIFGYRFNPSWDMTHLMEYCATHNIKIRQVAHGE